MTLGGIAVSRMAIEALGDLAVRVQDSTFPFSEVGDQLMQIASVLPSARQGWRVERLRLLRLALRDAEGHGLDPYALGASLLPRRALAAKRIVTLDGLLRKIDREANAETPLDPGAEESVTSLVGHVADPLLAETVNQWVVCRQSADDLAGRYGAVRLAIGAEAWRQDHGTFPEASSLASIARTLKGLHYVRHDSRDGYTVSVRDHGLGPFVLTRRAPPRT